MADASGTRRGSIVTAAGLDLRPLFNVFGQLGSWEFWVLGNEIGDRYLFNPKPDFVVGVLKPDQGGAAAKAGGLSNLDVMLRVGRAAERAIPALVLVPPSVSTPAPAIGVVFASCPLDDEQALNLHLWAFTRSVPTTSVSSSTEADDSPPTINATAIQQELRALPDRQPELGQRVEELTASLLQQAGAKLVKLAKTEGGRDDEVDIAILPSEDSRGVVLVDVKAGRLTEDRLARAEQQISSYAIDRQASLGVVIYHDTEGRGFSAKRPTPLAVRLSLQELVERLKFESLTKILSDAVADAIGGI